MTLHIANHFSRIKKFDAAIAIYNSLKIDGSSTSINNIIDFNIGYCERKVLNSSAPRSAEIEFDIILTTISSRIKNIDKVLSSLIAQKLPANKIFIYISKDPYLLDKGIPESEIKLLKSSFKDKVEFIYVVNHGPYRKILPYLEHHANQILEKNEKIFITVDDDTIYPEYFTQKLTENFLKHNCVVAFRGRNISIKSGNLAPYSEWQRGTTTPSFSNMPTGKDGVLYSSSFFPKEFTNIDLAKALAPTADDLWIKWNTALFGIKSLILNPEACDSDYKSFPLVDYSLEARENTLYKAHNQSGGSSKNDAAIKSLEQHFQRANFNLLQMLTSICDDYLAYI